MSQAAWSAPVLHLSFDQGMFAMRHALAALSFALLAACGGGGSSGGGGGGGRSARPAAQHRGGRAPPLAGHLGPTEAVDRAGAVARRQWLDQPADRHAASGRHAPCPCHRPRHGARRRPVPTSSSRRGGARRSTPTTSCASAPPSLPSQIFVISLNDPGDRRPRRPRPTTTCWSATRSATSAPCWTR